MDTQRQEAGARELRRPVYQTVAAVALAHAASIVYAGFAISGWVPLTVPVFFAWISAFFGLTLLLVVRFWQRRQAFGITAKAAMLLWAGMIFWFCGPAAVFFALSASLNAKQELWLGVIWFSELITLGGICQVLVPVAVLRRALRAQGRPGNDGEQAYQRLLKFPLLTVKIAFVVICFGWSVTALQFWWFSEMPFVEQCKMYLGHGFIGAFFPGTYYYLAMDALLSGVRGELGQRNAERGAAGRRLSRKILGVTLGISLGGATLLGPAS